MRHQGAGALLSLSLEAEALETLALAGGYNGLLAIAELLAAGVALAVGYRPYVSSRSWPSGSSGPLPSPGDIATEGRSGATLDSPSLTAGGTDGWPSNPTRPGTSPLREPFYERRCTAQLRHRSARHGPPGPRAACRQPRRMDVDGISGAPGPPAGRFRSRPLAASLGGVVLAFHGLEKLASGLTQLTDAAIAWSDVAPLLRTARPARHSRTPTKRPLPQTGLGSRLVVVSSSTTRRSSSDPAIVSCFRAPQGQASRRSSPCWVGCGLRPQVPSRERRRWPSRLSSTRTTCSGPALRSTCSLGRWPPTPKDLHDALDVCHELGLGPLLAEMPAGLEQPVGSVGWQLSHGERSPPLRRGERSSGTRR